MNNELECSLGECEYGPLSGMVVVLGNDDDGLQEEDEDGQGVDPEGKLLNYRGSNRPFALLHPMCFMKVFQELTEAEANVNLILAMGGIGDIRIALQM